jgi:hypothetical protein
MLNEITVYRLVISQDQWDDFFICCDINEKNKLENGLC